MIRRRFDALFALAVALCGVAALYAADGPLTNALNLRVRTDASGYLISTGGGYTAPDGPLTNFGNIRLRTDANGYLLTTSSPSANNLGYFNGLALAASGPGTLVWSSTVSPSGTADLGLSRSSQNVLAVGTGAQGSVAGSILASSIGLGGAALGGGATLSLASYTFLTLPTPANGTMAFCSDCKPTTPATCPATAASCVCAASGTGSFAFRVNGTWDCTVWQ